MSELPNSKLRIIELSVGMPLYAPASESSRTELASMILDLSEDSSGCEGVILFQKDPVPLVSREFLNQLDRHIYLDELVETIYSYRVLLESIRSSSVPWIYCSHADVFDSYFELAMACHERVALTENIRFGLPDMKQDMIPVGGTLEYAPKWFPKREEWLERPIMGSDAVPEAFVLLSGDDQNWVANLDKWLSNPNSLVIGNPIVEMGNKVGIVERQTALKLAQELEKEWINSSHGTSDGSYLQAYSQLLKRKNKFNSAQDFGWLVALLSAQCLLQQRYITAIQIQNTKLKVDYQISRSLCGLGEVSSPVVQINLDYLAPPAEVLAQLLRQDWQICFFAAEPGSLSVSLSLIYPRLDKFFSSSQLQERWHNQVSWGVSGQPVTTGAVLTFSVDDQMVLRCDSEERVFVRINGNHIDAGLGLLEHSEEQGDPTLSQWQLNLLHSLGSGLVVTAGLAGGELPLSYFFRSLFFEELMRVCQRNNSELIPIVELLAESNWGFAGSDAGWDRFLKTRFDSVTAPTPIFEEFGRVPSRSGWEIGSWKQARAYVKQSRANTEQRWSKTAIGHHLCVYLGIIAEFAVGKLGQKYSPEVDLLAKEALGVPDKFGLPLTYLHRYGRQRVRYYAEQFWPELRWDKALGAANE